MVSSEESTYEANCEQHGPFVGRALHLPMLRNPLRLGCPECSKIKKAAEAAEEARKDEERRQAAIEADKRHLRDSGVPLRFEAKTLETYAVEHDGHRKAMAAIMRLVTAIKGGRSAPNLLLLGKPGTGKSHLCCGMVTALYRTHKVRRIDMPDLIRNIRATWQRKSEYTEEEVLDWYGSLDLLILEEVGTGSGTEDERARIFQVINRRYEAMLPTVVVSNLSFEELKAEMGERVIDRLREGERTHVAFEWDSARGAQDKK